MNLFNQNYYIQLHLCKLKLEKKKKNKKNKNKNLGCKKDSMEKSLVNIYKFWNFDNRFLVGVGFKFLKLRCMLHVACFVKTLIITLF